MFMGAITNPGVDLTLDMSWEAVSMDDIFANELLEQYWLNQHAFVVAKSECIFKVLLSVLFTDFLQ